MLARHHSSDDTIEASQVAVISLKVQKSIASPDQAKFDPLFASSMKGMCLAHLEYDSQNLQSPQPSNVSVSGVGVHHTTTNQGLQQDWAVFLRFLRLGRRKNM
jgi:hypothetical protein